jgi:2-haloacid dehalogenase
MNRKISSVKALTFDVFGTVVDWRGSLIREGKQWGKTKGIQVDWPRFADAWRNGYRPILDRVRRGELPWMNLDRLHRLLLDPLLTEFGMVDASETEKDQLIRIWHRLKPWPDSVAGLRRLRKKFVLATLSNGNIALLTNMAKHARLPWDCILSAELARHYKPDKETYQMAAELLALAPQEIMMVAAHPDDLRAAQSLGFKAAFVARSLEWGRSHAPDPVPDPGFDVVADDFRDLASKLGA